MANPDSKAHPARPATGGRRLRWWPAPAGPHDSGSLDGVPETVVAPPPTLAAPTAHHPERSPDAAAPIPSAAVDDQGAHDRDQIRTDTVAEQTVDATTTPTTSITTSPSPDGPASTTTPLPPGLDIGLAPRTRRRHRILAGLLTGVIVAAVTAAWQWSTTADAPTEQVDRSAHSPGGPTVGDPPPWGTARTLKGDIRDAQAVAYSPDGQHLASGGQYRGRMLIWDISTGAARTLTGPAEDVKSVAYSPDGRHLATAADRAVRVWDLSTGRSRTLTGHTDVVRAVGYSSPDGRHLASAGSDGTVRIWSVETT